MESLTKENEPIDIKIPFTPFPILKKQAFKEEDKQIAPALKVPKQVKKSNIITYNNGRFQIYAH